MTEWLRALRGRRWRLTRDGDTKRPLRAFAAAVALVLLLGEVMLSRPEAITARLAFARVALGAFPANLADCDRLVGQWPPGRDARTARLKTRALLAAGCAPQAERLVRRVSRSAPDPFDRLWLGWALVRQERWPEGLSVWSSDRTTTQLAASMLVSEGRRSEADTRFGEAEGLYRRAASLNVLSMAFYRLGSLLLREQRLAEAETAAQEAIRAGFESHSQDYGPHLLLGTVYLNTGRQGLARTQLEAAASLPHDDYWVEYNLAEAYLRLKLPDEALRVLRTAPDTQTFYYYYELGRAYCSLGERTKGFQALQIARNSGVTAEQSALLEVDLRGCASSWGRPE